jgi:hypothetical protein
MGGGTLDIQVLSISTTSVPNYEIFKKPAIPESSALFFQTQSVSC